MALTEQCLGPLHLRVLQNTITTTSNLECLCTQVTVCVCNLIFMREFMSMCWVKEFASGVIHVKETQQTQQLLLMIAIFSLKRVPVGMFVCISACHFSPINFSRAFAACCREL